MCVWVERDFCFENKRRVRALLRRDFRERELLDDDDDDGFEEVKARILY